MGRVLVSVSHFNTLCKEAIGLLEEKGHEVIFDEKMNISDNLQLNTAKYIDLRAVLGTKASA